MSSIFRTPREVTRDVRIEELERQVTRLQDAFKIACAVADDRRKLRPHSMYYPDMMDEQSLAEMGLHPRDLDPIT